MPIETELETREPEIKSPFVKVVYLLEKFEKAGQSLAKLIPADYKALTENQKKQIIQRIDKLFREIKSVIR